MLRDNGATLVAEPADDDAPVDRARTRQILERLDWARAPAEAAPLPVPDGLLPPPPQRSRWLPFASAAAAGALLAGSGVYWFVDGSQAAPPAMPPAAVAMAPVRAALQASGFAVATRQATVSADVTGRVVEIAVSEGSQVRKGQVIARLDPHIPMADVAFASAQVTASRQNTEVTRTRIAAAATILGRREALAARGFASRASLDEARDAKLALEAQLKADFGAVEVARQQLGRQRELLESVTITAPFDGVVSALSANVGEIVSPMSAGGGFTRTGIGTIVDLTSLEGEVDLSEQYLSRVRTGDAVTVRLPAFPKVVVGGRVSAVTAAVNRSTAAVKVRIIFDRLPREMLPGMRIDIGFERPT